MRVSMQCYANAVDAAKELESRSRQTAGGPNAVGDNVEKGGFSNGTEWLFNSLRLGGGFGGDRWRRGLTLRFVLLTF